MSKELQAFFVLEAKGKVAMLAGRVHIVIETLCLAVVAGVALYSGWSYLDTLSDAEVLRGTQTLPIPLLSGAIHYAVGRGIGHDHKEEDGFPELAAFLSGDISAIPREAYPSADTYPEAGGHYLNMHYYLIGYLGIVFRVLGISVWSFRVACLLLHLATMLLLYGLFRLLMGRALSLLFVAYLAGSQVYLFMLPELRDYGKVPFLLGALLVTGIVLKRSRTPRRLWVASFFLGAIIGVGYGFRQDVFVCLPLALGCVLAGAKVRGERVFLSRVFACTLILLLFSLLAIPVFKGNREVGNTITAHTLFQGTMVCAEQNAEFGSVSYDSGFYNYDHPIIARIRGYAKRMGEEGVIEDLTPEYGKIGMRRFADVLCARPADFVGRVVAVADSLHWIGDAPIIRATGASQSGSAHVGREPLVPIAAQQGIASFFKTFGYMVTAVTLAVVAASSLGTAFVLVFFLGYLSAYTSTLFEFRHYFYLAFIPYLFLGILVTRSWVAFRRLSKLRKEDGVAGMTNSLLKTSFKGVSFVGVLALCVFVLLGVTRSIQKNHWSGLLDVYDTADLTRIDVEEEKDGEHVYWLLKASIPEMLGIGTPQESNIAAAYLAVKFRSAERTIHFRLLNRNSIFARPFNVSVQGGGTLFFPVYDFQHDPPFTFQGIEFDVDDAPYFEGLYWFPGAEKMRLWPCVYVPQERSAFEALKKGRIDRHLLLVAAELKSGFGLWPEKALAAYEELVKRHPFYAAFGRQALRHAARAEDEEVRLRTWKTVGSYMPHWRARCAQMIAEKAAYSLQEKDPSRAIQLYETACEVEPDEVLYLQRVAAIYESIGNKNEARDSYRRILSKSPEDGGVAYRLFSLDGELGLQEESIPFWEELGNTHPDAGIPWLYLGIILEECGEWSGAVAAYASVPDTTPVYPRALLRQGALNLRLNETEKGVEQLCAAWYLDPALQGRVLNTMRSSAIQRKEDHDIMGYLRLCEYLVAWAPGEADSRLMLADAFNLNGN